MFPKSLFLPLFLILISLASCFGSFLENPVDAGFDGNVVRRPHSARNDPLYYYYGVNLARGAPVRSPATSGLKIVNVDDFGAKANGNDDSQAFKKAWKEACSSTSSGGTVLFVPRNKIYTLKPVIFSGPCRSDLTLKIYGTIKATHAQSDYSKDFRHWIKFDNVHNFGVEGGGTINGNGKTWWQNSCKINKELPCKEAPTAVTFNECNNLAVSNLWFKDAQKMHVTFQKCTNVNAVNLIVTAPGNSPNTDGIHVTETQNINIRNCVIRTGDDCISIVSGSKNVRAIDITCGPGHGISIGSLGADNSASYVSNVLVNQATLSGTTNGVRIKTWQGGSGYARNIRFQNIVMHNVSNPIIIDQDYCDQSTPCHEQGSAVHVSNVLYKNIKGTSASEVAVKFDCSDSVPCRGIWMQDIHLERHEKSDSDDQITKASCKNVGFDSRGSVSPRCS